MSKKPDPEWDTYVEALDRIEARLLSHLGEDCAVEYSAYPVEGDPEVPVDNLDEVPHRGKIRFVARRDRYWGGEASREYRGETLDSPTWIDLCKEANRMILATNDHHHCFLEGIRVVDHDGDVAVAEFSMGS